MKILTTEIAKSLKGKMIQTHYSGYAGQDGVDKFKIGDIVSDFEIAEKTEIKGFKSQAEYWLSYMTPEQIDERKTKMMLLTEEGRNTYIYCNTKYTNIFTCTDADREVTFYII